MKWLYRFILPVFVLLTAETKSQTYTYHSFPDSNLTWIGFMGCGVHNTSWRTSWTMRITSDSIINGITYHNLSDVGLVREDSSRKVYFFNLTNFDTCSNERLLYDFSLSKDDTLTTILGKLIVTQIDTPNYFGIERRTLHLQHPDNLGYDIEIWIEGIGSSWGPMSLSPFYPTYCHWTYLCQAINNTITLYQGSYSTCFPSSILEEASIKKSIQIFPNPSTTSFNLQLSSPPTGETYFQLYDALGRQVKREEIISTTTTINRNNLPCGIYFWQLEQANKILERGKVVME